MSAGEWCLIESDPGVFTELIRGFGVQGVQVEEIWSLDEQSLEQLGHVHGLIFLYKWRQGEEPRGSIVEDSRLEEIFFSKQVVQNACATQAILSILMNVKHPDIDLGTVLSEMKEFGMSLDPVSRGLVLSNSEHIRKVHNSFGRQTLFEFDEKHVKKDEDAFHFVGYLPIKGRLYELDGLCDGPMDLGKCDQQNWLRDIKPVLDKRIQSFENDEIHFNLMALVSDKKRSYTKEIAELEHRKSLAAQRIQTLLDGEEVMDDDGSGLPITAEALQVFIEEAEAKVLSLQGSILQEDSKMEKYRLENICRRHNYLPLIMEILKVLAKRGELVRLCEQVKRKKATDKTAKGEESAKA
ncbi:hypothetical protein EMCRGX_G020121 [Ephydatia muelleri]